MKRGQCLKLIAKYHSGELVVPVYQATYRQTRPRVERQCVFLYHPLVRR